VSQSEDAVGLLDEEVRWSLLYYLEEEYDDVRRSYLMPEHKLAI
jgi:hypothetical protein